MALPTDQKVGGSSPFERASSEWVFGSRPAGRPISLTKDCLWTGGKAPFGGFAASRPRLVQRLGMSADEGPVPFEKDPPPAPMQDWTKEAPEEAEPAELSALQRFISKFRKS